MTIKIKLKEEAGSLPVKGVTLIWQIKDPKDGNAVIPIPKISESGVVSYVQSDTATTPENGEVEIPFMIPDLKEDQSYELFVTASKTTKSVTDSVSIYLACDSLVSCVGYSAEQLYIRGRIQWSMSSSATMKNSSVAPQSLLHIYDISTLAMRWLFRTRLVYPSGVK